MCEGKRKRSNDAYTPGGKAGFRPDYATIVYTNIFLFLLSNVNNNFLFIFNKYFNILNLLYFMI